LHWLPTRRNIKLVSRRCCQRRSGLASGLLLALVVVAGSGCGGASTQRADEQAATTAVATVQAPLVGTWRRLATCAELVAVFRKAGLDKWRVRGLIAVEHFHPLLEDSEYDHINPDYPCEGAVPRRENTRFFTKDGEFGSLGGDRYPVDSGTYRLGSTRTVVIRSNAFSPEMTFTYRIRGKTLTWAPVIPKGCNSLECGWAIAMAHPGKTWRRVH
jgi:hypothetical protein